MGEPERGLTPNGVVARDGDGGGEFIIERDMATERSAHEATLGRRMANPNAKVGSLDYARAVTSTKARAQISLGLKLQFRCKPGANNGIKCPRRSGAV